MDTTKVTIETDTIASTGNNVIQHTTIESQETNNCDSCWDNFCDCKILSDLIWPLTILLIIFSFYRKLKILIDHVGDRIKRGANVKVGPSGIEIQNVPEEEKAENEFNSIKEEVGETSQAEAIQKNEFIPKYIELERRFYYLLQKYFYPQFQILSNRRIDRYEYDIIMEATKPSDIDYIFEIKFYPNRYNKFHLQQAILRLDAATKLYINTRGKVAKPVLLIFVQESEMNREKFDEIQTFIRNNAGELKFISIAVFHIKEFDQITKDTLLDLMRKQ